MACIEVENLAKTYRVATKKGQGVLASMRGLFRRTYEHVHAVRDLSFTIEAGEMVAFLGPNGAGKTTTLKMLSGLIYPSAGAARVLGYIPWERADAYRRRFALVMGQKNQLWWDLPATESFRLHREIYTLDPVDFTRLRDELIDLLNLGTLVNRPVRELSLGERMKMELVAALLHSPQVLFLDEPTIGLDVVAQAQLRDFLKDYSRQREVTTLLTSHYMKDVESLCERVVVIHRGGLLYDGTLAGIISKFSSHKILKLQFAGPVPTDLGQYGMVQETRGPTATLRVARAQVPEALADVLSRHQVADITVDEVPLEEVIAEVFRAAAAEDASAENAIGRERAACGGTGRGPGGGRRHRSKG